MAGIRATTVWILSIIGVCIWLTLSNGFPAGFFDWHLSRTDGAVVFVAMAYYAFLYGMDRIVEAIEDLTDSQYEDEEA